MKTRTITAIVILAIITPLIVIGGIPFYLFIAIAIISAMFEVFKSTQKEDHKGCKDWPMAFKIIIVLSVIVSTFYPLITYALEHHQFGEISPSPELYVPAPIMFFIIFTLFAGAIFSKKFILSDVFYVGFMTIFLSLAGQATLICREHGNGMYIFLYVILICVLTDTCAYFSGMLFGKHKINPRISPKKTWEGAIGGTICATLISFIVGYFFFNFGVKGLNHWGSVLAISFALTIAAQFGDFTFSAIKRHFQIKDFGKIFPGHGGILDRLDSIFYNMIVMAIIITTISAW